MQKPATEPENGDQNVYLDLARANLLRMRGDLTRAMDLCRSVIERNPTSLTAHTLMGDIYVEQDDLDHAIEWYELALELAPDSRREQNRLDAIRARRDEREAVMAARQLGIPTTLNKARLFSVAAAAFVAIIGVGAFLVGERLREQGERPALVASVEVGRQPLVLLNPGASKPEPKPETVTPTATPTESVVVDDEALRQAKAQIKEGDRLINAMSDPRAKTIMLTFRVREGDDAPGLGRSIAVQALKAFPDQQMVTVRAVQGDVVVFMADLKRSELPTDDPDKTALINVWSGSESEGPKSAQVAG